jgi:uncharacterized protein (TIGR02271 family)
MTMAPQSSTPQASSSRTVTAFFDTKAAATDAVEELVKTGFPRASVKLVAGASQPSSSSSTASAGSDGGFWESLKELFFPEEDRHAYAEGLRRGGYLVTVSTTDANYQRALDILDQEGAVNMDQRTELWRKEGWTGCGSGSSGITSTNTGGEQVLPVTEEHLKVGKREVGHGRVRVRTYVVEKPVSAQVNLTHENVHVERRSVDRPAAAGEGAFQERTIEASETREVPVVSKEARVKEEVVVKKEAEQRTETVSDKVRRTDVKVDDSRGNAPDKRKAG